MTKKPAYRPKGEPASCTGGGPPCGPETLRTREGPKLPNYPERHSPHSFENQPPCHKAVNSAHALVPSDFFFTARSPAGKAPKALQKMLHVPT